MVRAQRRRGKPIEKDKLEAMKAQIVGVFDGQMDVFSWQNIHDLEFDFKISPLRNVTLRADYHAFWLESTEDAWYRANGNTTVRPLNAVSRAAGNYAGSEIDFVDDLIGASFKVVNPNATASCGCGTSFSI